MWINYFFHKILETEVHREHYQCDKHELIKISLEKKLILQLQDNYMLKLLL